MMEPTLYPPVGFCQPGQRDNNEDFIYPLLNEVGALDRLFLVCDGVGGGVNGEVASRIVAEQVAAYFRAHPGPSDGDTVLAALRSAEAALDGYLTNDPSAAGMATTMTLVHLHERGVTVAYVGDSRVYCCREGRVVFQTSDHKLVNEWVANGILTPEQAEEHPQRNVITRAVRGSAKPAQADVALLMGIKADDYFFLCTDGVLENLTTEKLCAVLATTDVDEQKLAAILHCCDGYTQDNYSAYLVHIQSVNEVNGNVKFDGQPPTAVPLREEPLALTPITDGLSSSVLAFDKCVLYLLVGLVLVGLASWHLVSHRKPFSSLASLWSQLSTPAKPPVFRPQHLLPLTPQHPHKR